MAEHQPRQTDTGPKGFATAFGQVLEGEARRLRGSGKTFEAGLFNRARLTLAEAAGECDTAMRQVFSPRQ